MPSMKMPEIVYHEEASSGLRAWNVAPVTAAHMRLLHAGVRPLRKASAERISALRFSEPIGDFLFGTQPVIDTTALKSILFRDEIGRRLHHVIAFFRAWFAVDRRLVRRRFTPSGRRLFGIGCGCRGPFRSAAFRCWRFLLANGSRSRFFGRRGTFRCALRCTRFRCRFRFANRSFFSHGRSLI